MITRLPPVRCSQVAPAQYSSGHVVGADLAGGCLAPVKDELPAPVAGVGDKGHTCRTVGQHPDMRGVDALLGKAVEDAAAKAILPDRADKSRRMAQACHGVDINRGVAAGKRAGERADLLKRLVQGDAHDLDQHGAQRHDLR